MKYWIDRLNADFIEGWAFDGDGIECIDVFVDDIPIGRTQPHLPRPDVSAAYPEVAPGVTGVCGFFLPFRSGHFHMDAPRSN
jgi:hypothetical protein